MEVRDLRRAPEHVAIIADRGWHAWWAGSDVPLAAYRNGVRAMTEADGIPVAMVAQDKGTYAGSVFLIDNDLEARPQYSPWIAALWVEPTYRRRGLAVKLIGTVRSEAHCLGWSHSYLCATAENSPYYAARGFQLIERDVGDVNVFRISNEDRD